MSKRQEFSEYESARLCFRGGAGEVTGSQTDLILPNGRRTIIDCGSHQGLEAFGPNGQQKDAAHLTKERVNDIAGVLITHAHYDHGGNVPTLVKKGYHRSIIATRGTVALLEPMLEDSAHVQAINRGRAKNGKQSSIKNPSGVVLYDASDVARTFRYLRGEDYYKEVPICKHERGLTATFNPTGHIIGSAAVGVQIYPNGHDGSLTLFSGDIGPPRHSIVGWRQKFAPDITLGPPDNFVIESTRADCDPVTHLQKVTALLSTIREVWKTGGNPIFPVLSSRLPELMELLFNLQKSGEIPKDCKFVVDAPLGMKILDVIKDLGPDYLDTSFGDDPDFYKTPEESMARFESPNLTVIEGNNRSREAAAKYANFPGKVIIMTSGGMGIGRILNYLDDFGEIPGNLLVQTSYQAEGTLGKKWQKNGNLDPQGRKARVVNISGFTGHASGQELIDYMELYDLSRLKRVFINHGELRANEALATLLRARGFSAEIIIPQVGQVFSL
ncbi:MAG: MBL fold metallo-hydrolase [Candidatus Shapirobacteria bacterium]